MDRIMIFAALLLAASVYAIVRGGAPERIIGFAFLIAAGLTRLLKEPISARFFTVETGVLIVDLALLAVLVAVALYADRYWPLWIAAFQALGTGGHLVRSLDADVAPVAYAILLASWSYPMILLLVLGTMRHAERQRRLGGDRDWSGMGGAFAGAA